MAHKGSGLLGVGPGVPLGKGVLTSVRVVPELHSVKLSLPTTSRADFASRRRGTGIWTNLALALGVLVLSPWSRV